MKKEVLIKLLNYTKSRKILRIILLYNNEELLENVINIFEKLYNTNRTESEKSELVMLYIKNRKKENIEFLICSSIILNAYSFKMQKERIKQYLSKEICYEQIINECYIKNMNEEFSEDKKVDETPKKKEHKKDKPIIRSSALITQNEAVLRYRTNQEIYQLIKIYYLDERGKLINLIVNKNVLQFRNNYEQIKLLHLYLDKQDDNVYNLIVNYKILKNMNLYEQLKLIDLYLNNNTINNYNKIIRLVNLNYTLEEIEQELKNDFENNIKILENK